MRDLTQGPIPGHLVAMAVPIAVGMLAQTLYFLIELYFVARLGGAALAGVGAAGTAMFLALTQVHGHTWPALASTASRIVAFMLPAIWLSMLPGYQLDQVWYVSLSSVWIQAAISFVLLQRTMKARLG